jgi:DNA-binding NarL/FixJ family response regulator
MTLLGRAGADTDVPGVAGDPGAGAVSSRGPILRVVVVDDHPVFRIGMHALVDALPDVAVAAQADDAASAVRALEEEQADVVVIDPELGGERAVDVIRELVRAAPGTRVLVITALDDDDTLFAALRAGARGYLLKGASPTDIERALRAVAAGEVVLGRQVADRAVRYLTGARTGGGLPFPELTAREREVLDLVARGHDNVTIARRLVLSTKTVRNHVYSILAKLDVDDRGTLIVRARESGLGIDAAGAAGR